MASFSICYSLHTVSSSKLWACQKGYGLMLIEFSDSAAYVVTAP